MPPDASKLIFGTMRMADAGRPVDEWVRFFCELHDYGVRTLHVSSEYPSYALACEVLRRVHATPGRRFDVMVKLGDPHFDEQDFSARRFEQRVIAYGEALGLEELAIVQWMWRAGLKGDAERCAAFRAVAPRIAEASRALKTRNRVGQMYCFPYSTAFGLEAVRTPGIDGLALYRNPAETESDTLVDVAAEQGKRIIAIRPFGAGSLIAQGRTPAELLEYALAPANVTGAVVTMSSLVHLREAMGAAGAEALV